MSATRPIPRGTLFARAVSALDNIGVRVSKPVTMNSILIGIHQVRGLGKPMSIILFSEGLEQIESWLAEQENKTLPESPDSWKTRPELRLSAAMLAQLERCRETRKGRSVI